MPTLEAGSRLDNIAKSVNVFLDINVKQALGFTVYYAGQDRIGTLPKRWVEADLIILGAIDIVHTGPGSQLAVWKECAVNLNCFEQLETGSAGSNLYTLVTMADQVREKFLISTAIPVSDYATPGLPRVGGLMVWESSTLSEVPTAPDAGIRQINIRVPLRYHEVLIL